MHKIGSNVDSCEHATFHACQCHDCAGTLHKWKGLLELAGDRATDRFGDGRDLWIRKRTEAWDKRTEMIAAQQRVVAKRRAVLNHSTPARRASKAAELATSERLLGQRVAASKGPATDYLDALLVRQLSGESRSGERANIAQLLEVQSAPVVEALRSDPSLPASERAAFMSGIAGSHLWCGLLAAQATALRLGDLDSRDALALFFSSREGLSFDEPGDISEAVIAAWGVQRKMIQPLFSTQAEFIYALRIAAVFICPAPEHHSFVLEHAAFPLITEVLFDQPLTNELLAVLQV